LPETILEKKKEKLVTRRELTRSKFPVSFGVCRNSWVGELSL